LLFQLAAGLLACSDWHFALHPLKGVYSAQALHTSLKMVVKTTAVYAGIRLAKM